VAANRKIFQFGHQNTQQRRWSMKKLTFYIVDVFAEEKYAGNQLAVIRNAEGLSDIEMQKIAKEMHFSETTFILSDEKHNGGYDVRIFSPEQELPFAGHPTLGTAYIIQREIIKKNSDKIVLNLKVGQIPVTLSYKGRYSDTLYMKQIQPTFDQTFDAEVISATLNLDVKDMDTRFQIQEVSTGVPFIIVPLKNLDALKRARLDKDSYFRLIEKTQAKSILMFCPETRKKKNHLSVRVFAEYLGVPEDPATGSANGCLAAYLVKHRYFGKEKINIRVEQGYEIGRPSLLLLRAEDKKGKIDVFVGGEVVMVAKGKLV
jgi:trans-2,3-dihydro-3-hydroxyanthranilate isomerase